jgi:hypothetical protein
MIVSRLHYACDLSSRRHHLQLLIGSVIGVTAAGGPFAHDTQGASEADSLQAVPKYGSVAAARVPQLIQQRQMGLNRALPNPEDISSPAADRCERTFSLVGRRVKRLAMLTPNRRPKLTPPCARHWAR